MLGVVVSAEGPKLWVVPIEHVCGPKQQVPLVGRNVARVGAVMQVRKAANRRRQRQALVRRTIRHVTTSVSVADQ